MEEEMKTNVSLVMQSFGAVHEYHRAIFSLWSFYSFAGPAFAKSQSIVFTDNPDFFKPWVQDLPVKFVLLSSESLKEMRGEIDFLHRIKICIIEEAFRITDGNLLYIDSDTFFTKDPSALLMAVGKRTAFMHTREYAFSELQELPLPSGESFQKVLRYIEQNDIRLTDGSVRRFSPALFSWNAGVIILDRAHVALLADVHAITSQLYLATRHHACEQYAFSFVLQTNCQVHGCENAVYHYWYRTKKQITDKFLAKRLDNRWLKLGLASRKATTRKWAVKLPQYFQRHSLTLRDNAIQAFNRNEFATGNLWALRALLRNPFDIAFLRDFGYHNKRFIFFNRT